MSPLLTQAARLVVAPIAISNPVAAVVVPALVYVALRRCISLNFSLS